MIDRTDYVWPTDPALIDPILCSQFHDCDVSSWSTPLQSLEQSNLALILFCSIVRATKIASMSGRSTSTDGELPDLFSARKNAVDLPCTKTRMLSRCPDARLNQISVSLLIIINFVANRPDPPVSPALCNNLFMGINSFILPACAGLKRRHSPAPQV